MVEEYKRGGSRMLKLDYGSGQYDSFGKIHDSFPPAGRPQPAHEGSQSEVPSKGQEPETGALN